jgi:membrane-bound lytic murein transglycosylase F
MRKGLIKKFSTLLSLCMVLMLSFSMRQTVTDWHKDGLMVILPPEDSLDYQFNRQLAELFASQLGVKFRIMELYPYQIADAFSEHLAHFSAIGMRANEADPAVKFGVPFQIVNESVVCGGEQPKKLGDLNSRKIVVVKDSAEEAVLNLVQMSEPALNWSAINKAKPGDLLEEMSNGELDCTVANEEQIAYMRNFYPGMDVALDIGTPTQLAWSFPATVDAELYTKMEQFFARIEDDGTLELLLNRFYGHTDRLIPFDAAAFLTKANTILPRYRSMFEEAGALTGIEWQLLAAMSYRESRWNPLATSYTKVRGMMMLTEDTADRMNVSNRLDPRESIMAGARYLQLLKEQLPLRIEEPERTWLALAAYNQGMGHLEDARMLSQRYGLNPDQWIDVQKAMVKLHNPSIAKTLKHGYARGGEAVIFVETVRLYSDMLKRISRDEYRLLLPHDYQFKLNAW